MPCRTLQEITKVLNCTQKPTEIHCSFWSKGVTFRYLSLLNSGPMKLLASLQGQHCNNSVRRYLNSWASGWLLDMALDILRWLHNSGWFSCRISSQQFFNCTLAQLDRPKICWKFWKPLIFLKNITKCSESQFDIVVKAPG